MAIVDVKITDTDLVVTPKGINKVWGLAGEASFPLTSITGVSTGEASLHRQKGFRSPGLGWINRWVGTFRKDGYKAYWCATTGPTLELTVTGEPFDTLVLGPENPQELADQLNRQLNKRI